MPSNLISLSNLRAHIGKLTGVLVSRYAIRRWLETGELKTITNPNGDRRKKYVTERELLRFIEANTEEEKIKWSEDLKPYVKSISQKSQKQRSNSSQRHNH